MTEDIAYDFDIGSRINLSACITVPKRCAPITLAAKPAKRA